MDSSNWRSNQGGGGTISKSSMHSGDWRSLLHRTSRQRMTNRIMVTLKRHLPFSGHEGLQELRKIAGRFEEKIYTSSTSRFNYLRTMSLKMMTMETRSQNPTPNAMHPDFQVMQEANNQRQPLPTSVRCYYPQPRQQLLSQTMNNNIGSSSLSFAFPLDTAIPQSTMPNVAGQNSSLPEASSHSTAHLGKWTRCQVGSGAIGDSSIESGDWRSQLPPDSRQRIVNKIMDTLKRHLPFSGDEGLQEHKKIAERFEEKVYMAATSQSDYLRKISLKMLTMETRRQNPMPDAMQSNSGANSDPGYQVMQEGQPLPVHVPSNHPQSGQQQLLSQTMHNNSGSTAMQGSSSLSFALPPGTGLLQSTMPNVARQNSSLQEAFSHAYMHTAQMGSQGGSGAIGDSCIECGDWRSQLPPDSRQRIVNKIMATLKTHLPLSRDEELKESAVRFEEKIYTSAISQPDYLRKISLKMLTMETRS